MLIFCALLAVVEKQEEISCSFFFAKTKNWKVKGAALLFRITHFFSTPSTRHERATTPKKDEPRLRRVRAPLHHHQGAQPTALGSAVHAITLFSKNKKGLSLQK
jgi:hypothetical protein